MLLAVVVEKKFPLKLIRETAARVKNTHGEHAQYRDLKNFCSGDVTKNNGFRGYKEFLACVLKGEFS